MNLKQIVSKVLAIFKLKKIKKEDCVVKNLNISFFDIPKCVCLVIKKYGWVVFFLKIVNYIKLVFQKYKTKIKKLCGELIYSLWEEGLLRATMRTTNYLFYGKGILSRKELAIKRNYCKSSVHKSITKKNTHNIHPLKTVYYVSNTEEGSKKYIYDLIDTFETCHLNFVQIKNKADLNYYKKFFKKNGIFLFQYFFYSDLTFDDIIDVKKKYGLKLIIPIHDFYFLQKKPSNFYQFSNKVHRAYKDKLSFNLPVFNLLKTADLIIYPSNFVKNIFDSVFIFENATLSNHIDYKICNFLNIPSVDKCINIGIINNITIYKGANYYPTLFSIKSHRGYRIKYHVFGRNEIMLPNVIFHGPYAEEEIFELLKKNNIHGLVFLNKWGETYSYSLTKGINSGLPILYSNIGAYVERLRNNPKFFPVDDIQNININFQKMLDLVLEKQGIAVNNDYFESDKLKKYVPDFYKNLFSIDYDTILNEKFNKNKRQYNEIFNFVEPYAIYFPQFHALKENDKTFYEGYHDMANLEKAKKADQSIETPLKNYLGYYNLKKDKSIVEKQILLAKSYGIKGFAIYYYWFSQNSITGNNMIMKDVIDKFFKKDLDDFDVFFIYANESWSKNPAFNQYDNEYTIQNKYFKNEIIKNFNNLLPYFKNKNYKKIDNKPVFFIHHPWEMTSEEFKLFYFLGNEIVKKNGFSGLELVVNGICQHYKECLNYFHHPNYKSVGNFNSIENDGVRYIDYKKYVDDYLPSIKNLNDNIETVFYNFNNIVRYFNHKNKKVLITKTKNNNIEYFKKFLTFQLNKYLHRKKVEKIFLLNSWNEWGEQMAFEPSSESGFELLDIFNNSILKFAKNIKNKKSSKK